MGHPTPSESTTTVAIVTRGRSACYHRISPGPSHPAGTTDCSHCCITELLGLQARGRGESDMSSNEGTASVESICVNKQVGTHSLVSFSSPLTSTCLHSHSFNCPLYISLHSPFPSLPPPPSSTMPSLSSFLILPILLPPLLSFFSPLPFFHSLSIPLLGGQLHGRDWTRPRQGQLLQRNSTAALESKIFKNSHTRNMWTLKHVHPHLMFFSPKPCCPTFFISS